jgi:hypothetical protein
MRNVKRIDIHEGLCLAVACIGTSRDGVELQCIVLGGVMSTDQEMGQGEGKGCGSLEVWVGPLGVYMLGGMVWWGETKRYCTRAYMFPFCAMKGWTWSLLVALWLVDSSYPAIAEMGDFLEFKSARLFTGNATST